MKEIFDIVLHWLIPFICCGAITWITGFYGKNKAMREGVRSLLRAEIIRAYEKYTERGYCPIYAREPLTRVSRHTTEWAETEPARTFTKRR